MNRIRNVVPILLIFGISHGFAVAKWPEGYAVHENTESPDGQYGIIVPEEESMDDNGSAVNYLANLKTHQTLGKIKGSDYFEHQNHAGLSVVWADDSSWSVGEYDSRFGFASISMLEPKRSTFSQTDIGDKIDKDLAAVLHKQSREPDEGGGAEVTFFRLGHDRKLR